jgi:hypothetical protein
MGTARGEHRCKAAEGGRSLYFDGGERGRFIGGGVFLRDWGGFEVGLGRFGEDFGDFEGDWGVNGWKMGEMFGGMGNFAYFCGVILMFF